MKLLVTAGPTREPIDPVRFLTNRSSGKMGYAIARSAIQHGYEVVLISGPVSILPPHKAEVIHVTTAEDMLHAVQGRVSWCDVLVMAAAVADWRPQHYSPHKIKKLNMPTTLQLEPIPDIIRSVLPNKGKRLFVGFAAETENLQSAARQKLLDKKLDLIVANNVKEADSGFEVDTNRVTLISSDGKCEELALMSKNDVADRIIQWVDGNYSGTKLHRHKGVGG